MVLSRQTEKCMMQVEKEIISHQRLNDFLCYIPHHPEVLQCTFMRPLSRAYVKVQTVLLQMNTRIKMKIIYVILVMRDWLCFNRYATVFHGANVYTNQLSKISIFLLCTDLMNQACYLVIVFFFSFVVTSLSRKNGNVN